MGLQFPKWKLLWECDGLFLTLSFTFGLPSWLATLQAFALVTSPRLGLRHETTTFPLIIFSMFGHTTLRTLRTLHTLRFVLWRRIKPPPPFLRPMNLLLIFLCYFSMVKMNWALDLEAQQISRLNDHFLIVDRIRRAGRSAHQGNGWL